MELCTIVFFDVPSSKPNSLEHDEDLSNLFLLLDGMQILIDELGGTHGVYQEIVWVLEMLGMVTQGYPPEDSLDTDLFEYPGLFFEAAVSTLDTSVFERDLAVRMTEIFVAWIQVDYTATFCHSATV